MNESSEITLELLQRHFSPARLAPFLERCESPQAVIALYEQNVLAGLRFMLVMHFLEIMLRNDMDGAMCHLLGKHWFQRQDALLKPLKEHVAQAQERLRSQGKRRTHDNYIAELPLGFWTGLLSKKYEYRHQYWRRCLHRCFPHRPRTVERSQLHDRLDTLRRFRNRVAHQERIFHHAPEQKIMQALEVIGWINPVMRNWALQLLERMP